MADGAGQVREPARRHVVLVGLPGAGKSTVGPILAAALGWPFHDLDEAIVRREGRSITEIFSESGEPFFRDLETMISRELLAGSPSVISTGGGWIVSDDNVTAARTAALIVHLRVTPPTAAARMATDAHLRPLLGSAETTQRLEELWVSRRERYSLADVEVDTEVLDPEEVAASIVKLIERPGA